MKFLKLRDGSFYYIENVKTVDEAFINALGGLISVVGINLKILVSVIN